MTAKGEPISMGTFLHFAYGSNMNMKDFKDYFREKGYDPSSIQILGNAILRDYKLAFNYYSSNRGGGAANIMECKGKHVEGLLLEMDDDLRTPLRGKEGHPSFYRETDQLKIELEDGTVVFMITYVVTPEKRREGHVPPTRYYLDIILEAARKYNFSKKYIEMLENIECKK